MNTSRPLLLLLSFWLIGLVACKQHLIEVPPSPYPLSEDTFSLDTIAKGFVIPYGLAVLGEEELFFTDRIGKMFHYQAGELTEIGGMPEVVTFGVPGIPAILHGGLMEVSLHPNYAINQWIYTTYLATDGLAKVVRFKILDDTAVQFETIFETRHQSYTGNGMRMVWQDSSRFFLNIGNSDLSTRDQPVLYAQDIHHDAGKIHRLKEDGTIPPDNPLLDTFSRPTTIWSYGHRDVQGLHYEASTETLFGIEHGPKGGDEFNLIEQGKNYGWPLFSYGVNYDGQWVSLITEDSAASFTELPVHQWTVSTQYGGQAVAPACLLKVEDSKVLDWNGYFLFGSLAYRRLMKYNHTTGETFGVALEGRVRTIQQLPSGDLIALIERNNLRLANGMLVRISE